MCPKESCAASALNRVHKHWKLHCHSIPIIFLKMYLLVFLIHIPANILQLYYISHKLYVFRLILWTIWYLSDFRIFISVKEKTEVKFSRIKKNIFI
jgi:hypothetical protein